MAIWQYALIVVPFTEDFTNRFDDFIAQEKTKYLRESDMFWNGIDFDINQLAQYIDTVIPRAPFSTQYNYCWKSYIDALEDNDCSIFVESQKITSFTLRFDVRYHLNIKKIIEFLIAFCSEFGLTLINYKYEHVAPDLDALIQDVVQSNAVKFLEDPNTFLDGLSTLTWG